MLHTCMYGIYIAHLYVCTCLKLLCKWHVWTVCFMTQSSVHKLYYVCGCQVHTCQLLSNFQHIHYNAYTGQHFALWGHAILSTCYYMYMYIHTHTLIPPYLWCIHVYMYMHTHTSCMYVHTHLLVHYPMAMYLYMCNAYQLCMYPVLASTST